jgi:hypothetical protein
MEPLGQHSIGTATAPKSPPNFNRQQRDIASKEQPKRRIAPSVESSVSDRPLSAIVYQRISTTTVQRNTPERRVAAPIQLRAKILVMIPGTWQPNQRFTLGFHLPDHQATTKSRKLSTAADSSSPRG